ncbi:class F sortase [Paractinoplanes lichenicola]|uniref:Class F sortase n=1 Tax=Paractinoplanes lichenicola TaxID=2802976 RepID=A0ABS1VJ08_9ACTN|nr:class F sortase [Actinoplanes lichenicola]MBL7253456.1 class F sortase [Actinoplanes lichenicola]
MTRPRTFALVIAALLAIAGAAAIAVGRHEQPAAEPPRSAPPSASTTKSPATKRPETGTDELTRGTLLPTSAPTRVRIPALHVDEPVTGLGQNPDGSMQVPTDARTVGWYTEAPTPGSLGPAVLAGHVNYHGTDGTFARLSTLHPGDQVEVTRQDGVTAVFAITRVDRYAKDRFPADAVYGAIDHAGLRLITCGGDFDDRTGHYVDNIVAYAELRTAVGRSRAGRSQPARSAAAA